MRCGAEAVVVARVQIGSFANRSASVISECDVRMPMTDPKMTNAARSAYRSTPQERDKNPDRKGVRSTGFKNGIDRIVVYVTSN